MNLTPFVGKRQGIAICKGSYLYNDNWNTEAAPDTSIVIAISSDEGIVLAIEKKPRLDGTLGAVSKVSNHIGIALPLDSNNRSAIIKSAEAKAQEHEMRHNKAIMPRALAEACAEVAIIAGYAQGCREVCIQCGNGECLTVFGVIFKEDKLEMLSDKARDGLMGAYFALNAITTRIGTKNFHVILLKNDGDQQGIFEQVENHQWNNLVKEQQYVTSDEVQI
ncbi:hypothetical protein QR680_003125 [Steinernema hermaphroditum]|uniref:Uncharacterized protein n=1 Tax=Steinernema hermaphroditum TaxID=289476 RepID=A0AA39H5G6_9BILA|nr:hypothetical protein QR680_003125 [Steinernema hermaphroditum]